MSQLSVLSISPREQLPISSDGHGMSPSTVYRHLPHHVHAEVTEDTRRGNVAQSSHSEATVGSLTTSVDLAVLGDDKESLGATHELNWAEFSQALAVIGSLHLVQKQEMVQITLIIAYR